jgi:HSP20 family protein
MANLARWDPFQEMTSLRDAMNQLLAESFVRPSGMAGAFQPPVDLYETENEYVVKLAAPGLKPDNFEITMQQNMLTIQGRTQQEDEKQEGARYHVREQRFGEFLRTVQFPSQVDADKIQASLSNGILTIRVPKAEAAKPRRITVKAS